LKYYSTRGDKSALTSAEAIKRGIAPDGGLYMPETIPTLTEEELVKLLGMNYSERAFYVLSKFLNDYDPETLKKICEVSYSKERFGENAAPVVKLSDGTSVLELWHGPTCAFKDMALQIMPRLLSRALKKTGEQRCAYILVATSGDTGKAALEGYKDVDSTKIMVFYPEDGVSDMQKMQMATQEGGNVCVTAIKGNFDDAQTGVKKIFADAEAKAKLDEKGSFLSSANSINWGRLAPQIVYYISAYADLVNEGDITLGEKVDITVPTGNFGNIFAAYLAKKMGLPVNKFICASNSNNILTDFLRTGTYDRNRQFYTTMSPSMDILISSNLERLLYFIAGAEKTTQYMKDLSEKGVYTVEEDVLSVIKSEFAAYCCNEEDCAQTISRTFDKYSYICDPHTAVAVKAALDFVKDENTGFKNIVASTASPYKFAADVLKSLGKDIPSDMKEVLDTLSEITKTDVPAPLATLFGKSVRFTKSVERNHKSLLGEVLSF